MKLSPSSQNLMINWEYLKFKMREVARNRSIELVKERREKRTNLECKVKKFLSMNELSIVLCRIRKCKARAGQNL